ncbi:MAG: hypothetical protein ACRDP6_23905 [Actinoallomurus sp.]
MTEELENALRRTLTDAAERAPKAPSGIGLEPRRARTSRGYSRVVLAAAAVAVAIGGATVGGRMVLSGSGSPPGTSPARHPAAAKSPVLHRPKKTNVPSIEKVWPGVAFRVPKTLPNGHAFHPEALIDGRTILVSTESSFEKADALYAYDLRNHTARPITTVVTPPKTKVFASDFTVGGGYAAWWLYDGSRTEIWAAPLSGGQARLVGQVSSRGLSRLAIAGKDAVWSLDPVGGVYRAPVTGGGTAQLVPGSASMHILAWPWIGTPPTTRGGGKGMGVGITAFGHVKNALTGETRSAHLTDRGAWHCGLTWCVGQGPNFVTEAQRRDGSGRRAIPAQDPMLGIPPILDRFAVVFPSGGTVAVYDLRNGKIGDLRIQYAKGGRSFVVPRDPASRLYWTTTADGYMIVDLGAI